MTVIFNSIGLIRLSRFLSYTNHKSGKFQSFHVQTAWQYNSVWLGRFVWLDSSAEVTFIPVLHELFMEAGTFLFKRPKWLDRSKRTTFKGGSKYTGRTETKLVRSIWFPTEISRILDWIESARDYLENFQPESRQHNTGIPANRAGSALSFIARFYALPLDLTEFSKPPPPEPTHPKFMPPHPQTP